MSLVRVKTSTMRAFVMRRIDVVGVIEKPVPEVGPEDALVRTTGALICTSDGHTVHGAIGERVRDLAVGDRVVAGAITPCWTCANCQRGFTSQCGELLGGWKFANVKDGTLAEYFHVNQASANLARIPDDVTDELAAYCSDMISTGLVAAEHAAIPPGGTVAVFGQGPVGLMATACARLLGAGRIVTVETVPARKALSLRYGAERVVDFRAADPVDAILEWTGGEGVDSAIEALGSAETFEACVRVTRPGGTISNVGYHGDGEIVPIPRRAWGVGMSDHTIRTGLCPGGSERLRRLLRLVQSGRIDPTPLTTHRFSFAEIERAFALMRSKADGILKPWIVFDR